MVNSGVLSEVAGIGGWPELGGVDLSSPCEGEYLLNSNPWSVAWLCTKHIRIHILSSTNLAS